MMFPENKDKTPVFSQNFNQMAGHPLDCVAFYAQAKANGYTEARIMFAGTSALFEHTRNADRITVQTHEDGRVKRYLFG